MEVATETKGCRNEHKKSEMAVELIDQLSKVSKRDSNEK